MVRRACRCYRRARTRPGVSVGHVIFGMLRARLLLTTAGLAAVVVAACSACGSAGPGTRSASPTRSLATPTTQIAGAGVLGYDRRPDQSCAGEPAAADPGPATREAHNAAGVTPAVVGVPAEASRIVVLAGDELDALCALGLQSRVVAAALPDGASAQPGYLGSAVRGLPGAGTRSKPDLGGIAAAHPDLILGSQGLTPTLYPELAAIAPTVFTAAPGAAWEDNLRSVGAATARGGAVDKLIAGFSELASRTGAKHDAAHYQASIVQLTTDTLRVYGARNFPASVLDAVGVDRPASQRFTDKAYVEMGTTDADLDRSPNPPDFSVADADVVYVSCASPAAAQRAATLFDSAPWRKLSATRDNRVFVVNDEIWQTGQGLVAARGIVDDLRWVNAPIN